MYEFDSRVRYSETDAQGRMTWLALMDYFQDCSVFHSEAVNLGVEVWTDAQKAWILSSWQICLNRMPRLGEQITTQTWAYGMKGFYGYRNFSMNGRDGEPQLPMQCSERKIMLPEKYEEKDSLVVPSYFIDTNHHMNNTRYVQVAMEYVPKEFRTMEVRVEYKKAAMCRDVIVPHVTIEDPRVTVALCAPDGQPYAVVVFLKA